MSDKTNVGIKYKMKCIRRTFYIRARLMYEVVFQKPQ